MAKKNARNTRGRIVNAAWKLFYEQGYEDTTVEEIIDLSRTSRGPFYHYFDGKDALLSTLSTLFDEKYEELIEQLDPDMTAMDTLLFLNRELFGMIENSISIELLTRLLSTQLITNGEKHLLDRDRIYYKLLRENHLRRPGARPAHHPAQRQRMVKRYALCDARPDVRLVPVRRRILPGALQRAGASGIPQQLSALTPLTPFRC